MKTNFRRFIVVSATAALLAFAAAAATSSADPRLRRPIEKANSEFEAAVKTGEAVTIAAPYTDRAVFVGVDGACTQGPAEIETLYRAGFERAGLPSSAKINSKRLVVGGDLAYESGYGEVSSVKDGKVSVNAGRFLTVWQRQADGGWKILRNIVLP
jgi:uncharacterized protein (TIGR02246 family)